MDSSSSLSFSAAIASANLRFAFSTFICLSAAPVKLRFAAASSTACSA